MKSNEQSIKSSSGAIDENKLAKITAACGLVCSVCSEVEICGGCQKSECDFMPDCGVEQKIQSGCVCIDFSSRKNKYVKPKRGRLRYMQLFRALSILSPGIRTHSSTFRNRTLGREAVDLLTSERAVLGEVHHPTLTVFPDLSSHGQAAIANLNFF
jgi:hypothetical protein